MKFIFLTPGIRRRDNIIANHKQPLHRTNPIVAGAITARPASPEKVILHNNLPAAMNAMTATPSQTFRHHNAMAKVVKDNGISNVRKILRNVHSPCKYCCSTCKNCCTCELVSLGGANHPMLVKVKNITIIIPAQLRRYANQQNGIKNNGRIYQLS